MAPQLIFQRDASSSGRYGWGSGRFNDVVEVLVLVLEPLVVVSFSNV